MGGMNSSSSKEREIGCDKVIFCLLIYQSHYAIFMHFNNIRVEVDVTMMLRHATFVCVMIESSYAVGILYLHAKLNSHMNDVNKTMLKLFCASQRHVCI